jgi:hypothetical protein
MNVTKLPRFSVFCDGSNKIFTSKRIRWCFYVASMERRTSENAYPSVLIII